MITTLKDWKIFKESNNYDIKLDKQTIFDYIDFSNDKDLYPGHSDIENDFTDDYFFNTEKEANEYVNKIMQLFNGLPNPIPVFRCIKAKSENDIDLEMVGESWSYDKQSALNFGSRNGSNFLLSAFINKENVNWQGTIKAYVLFSNNFSDENENEIVIDEQDKLQNIKITKLK